MGVLDQETVLRQVLRQVGETWLLYAHVAIAISAPCAGLLCAPIQGSGPPCGVYDTDNCALKLFLPSA